MFFSLESVANLIADQEWLCSKIELGGLLTYYDDLSFFLFYIYNDCYLMCLSGARVLTFWL